MTGVQAGASIMVEDVDTRPKPRQAIGSIVASGLSPDDLARLTAQGFQIEAQTPGRITPQTSGCACLKAPPRSRPGKPSSWSMRGPRLISITSTISMKGREPAVVPSAKQPLS
jgi:hypothetical protein